MINSKNSLFQTLLRKPSYYIYFKNDMHMQHLKNPCGLTLQMAKLYHHTLRTYALSCTAQHYISAEKIDKHLVLRTEKLRTLDPTARQTDQKVLNPLDSSGQQTSTTVSKPTSAYIKICSSQTLRSVYHIC